MAEVAIVGGTEEIRLLLRGLVRLHHHQVIAEGTSPEVLDRLQPNGSQRVAILDVDVEDAVWAKAVSGALARDPGMRIVLIVRSRTGRVESRAKELGIGPVLRAPFAVHALIEAIAPTAPTG